MNWSSSMVRFFANVWQTDRIARISPQNGEVVGWIDLKGLLSPVYRLAIRCRPEWNRLRFTSESDFL